MAKYIDRESAIRMLRGSAVAKYPFSFYTGLFASADELQRMSAADVAPVRNGRWIENGKYTFGIMCDCSLCENRILDNGHSWNYCPNCGAKMGGGND